MEQLINRSESRFPTFYVDDSVCEIASRKHFILAAIQFRDEDIVLSYWAEQKLRFGLPPYEEVKWNSKRLTVEERRSFIPIVGSGTGIVAISDIDKQDAAKMICEQVWRYCTENSLLGFRIRFDRNIVSDWSELQSDVRAYHPPCVGLSEADSASEHLIQAADFLAGAVKLKIDFATGLRDPNQVIKLSANHYAMRAGEECHVGWFMFGSLRYCIWGHTSAAPEKPHDPWKATFGRGLVYHSSAADADVLQALSGLDGMFMGCIH